MSASSRLTAADVAAAVRLGTLDPSTPLAEDTEAARAAAARVAAEAIERLGAPVALPADRHDCGIANCRHGESHTGISQPDRQVKLACPTCGAVARMTATALRRSGGVRCIADGVDFAVAPRRVYSRRGA